MAVRTPGVRIRVEAPNFGWFWTQMAIAQLLYNIFTRSKRRVQIDSFIYRNAIAGIT